MSFYCCLVCTVCLLTHFVPPTQLSDTKDAPENRGELTNGNVYHNPTLSLTISLPGTWHFFDREKYSTPESRRKDEEIDERARTSCEGPLCGHGDIDVAFQSPSNPPLKYAVYLTAYKLSLEYQNRIRHPLKKFAEVMTLGSMGDEWTVDGELTPIQIGGRPGYRLILRHRRTASARTFCYVSDSNGRVFLIVAVAISEPEKLQAAIENLKFKNAAY